MKMFLMAALLLSNINLFAQDSVKTAVQASNPFSFNGYIEAYYQYDFNKPGRLLSAGLLKSY